MSTPAPQLTRRERRAAERAAHKQPQQRDAGVAWRSPIMLMTLAAAVVGLVVIGVIAFGAMSGGAGDTSMRTPPAALPAGVVLDGRSLGQADAPVAIDVYEDPQCPVCGRWTRDLEPLLVASYVRDGTVRLTYHDYVFIGPELLDAAVGMRAADQLGGKFWDYHDLVFENQNGENAGAFTRAHLATLAGMAGLDKAAFLAKLDDPGLVAAVKAETVSWNPAGYQLDTHPGRRRCRPQGSADLGPALQPHRLGRRRVPRRLPPGSPPSPVAAPRPPSPGASTRLALARLAPRGLEAGSFAPKARRRHRGGAIRHLQPGSAGTVAQVRMHRCFAPWTPSTSYRPRSAAPWRTRCASPCCTSLAGGPCEVNRLARDLDISQPNASQHLSVMRAAGLVLSERDGREVLYRLADPEILTACDQMARVMRRRLARMADLSAWLGGAPDAPDASLAAAREPVAPSHRSR